MPIYKGSTEVTAGNLKLGSQDVKEVYLGSTKIWPSAPIISGGDKFNEGAYTYHIFKSSGTLTVENTSVTAEIFMVGGGGGSAGFCGGGGGGGQIFQATRTVSNGSHAVTVGEGGTGVFNNAQDTVGGDGGNSSFFGVTAIGGKGGRSRYQDGYTGFSGYVTANVGRGGDSGSGKLGADSMGNTTSSQQGSGGGGGHVGAGQKGSKAGSYTGNGGAGGVGSNRPSGWTSRMPAAFGGGGGGGIFSMGTVGAGQHGGGDGGRGGDKNTLETIAATAGTPNTGGGAGGAGRDGKNGGSGIVVIRYPIITRESVKESIKESLKKDRAE